MDELYRFQQYSSNNSSSCPPVDTSNFLGDGNSSDHHNHSNLLLFTTSDHHHHHHHDQMPTTGLEEMSDLIKAQIANHPFYPNLLSAHIQCTKVGASPEMVSILEEISKENIPMSTFTTQIGIDPELDHFMRSYCEVLHKYKEELSKPFDEATNFLSSMESQLIDLCKQTLPSTSTSSAATAAEEDINCGEVEAMSEYSIGNDDELKEMLMRKYSGYLTSLRKEFLNKRKKGKLPKDAITALIQWWKTHYRWPYPTEEEKNMLSEITGLDQKQINNWFINQRKRHWRPSEDMRFALMEGVSGTNPVGSLYFDAAGGT